ncbi:MAG: hypothetical protein DI569_01395 [Sphingopyxis macrogoltabida]|uniref:HTH tetR-type domain-containing protein n=1 Tax=Sphingopyxis macrogoltabida TaxID=33050 RepID=A0A2W5L854_SPHMC|nr:MAG: hypothetical protein DI569_01395 [Sphingopyxis macrogoltabida]
MTAKERPKPKSPVAKRRRTQGRPPLESNKSVGREAVIAATRRILKRATPLQISRAEVAREAGADPSLIRYYFGKKNQLLLEVAREISKDAANRVKPVDPSTSVTQRLKLRITGFILMLRENPHVHNMLVSIIAYHEGYDDKQKEFIRQNMILNPVKDLEALIDEGVASGEFRKVDAKMLHMALIGMCEFAVTAFPIFSIMAGEELDTDETLAKYVDFVADLVISGLKPERA